MNIKEIETLSFSEQMYLLKQNGNKVNLSKIRKNIAFYEGKHPILTDPNTQDYWIKEGYMDTDGTKKERDICVKKERLILHYAKQIVGSMVAWLYGNDITVVMEGDRENEDAKKSFDFLQEILSKDVRLMAVLKEATRSCGIETRSAIQFLWDGSKIKAKVLNYQNGYQIWRHKDDYGKVDCVVVEYKRDYIKDGKLKKDVVTTEKWTANGVWRYEGSTFIESIPAPINKLLFDYLEQDESEFEGIISLAIRQEYSRSQHAGVNTRIGNPPIVVEGKIETKPLYNDDVKIFEMTPSNSFDPSTRSGGSMKFLELSSAPESVKLEMTMNENDIYRFTWPDLNKLMTDMKNGNMSSQSMKLTFLQAFVKLAEKQEVHDEFVQRALNIVRDMAAELYPEYKGMKDLKVSFHYNSILPDSTVDMVNMLAVAVGAGITSQENAVRILDINTPETLQEIRREQLAKAISEQKKVETVETVDNPRNKEGIN